MMRKVIFLDIDGVLNDHEWNDVAQSCSIRRDCMDQLNRIIKETNACIVLSSAWRYMILGGVMTLPGFEYMLQTHGFTSEGDIVGHTLADKNINDQSDRAKRIMDWLEQAADPPESYLIIDDEDFGFTKHSLPFLWTVGERGLTPADADRAIVILNERKDQPDGD